MDQFIKHKVNWNEEKVKRFWDYFVDNPALLKLSFASEVGQDIIKRTRKYLRKDFKILDYGCGGGALIGHLIASGFSCQGLDTSYESLENVKKYFTGNNLFKGVVYSTGLPNHEIKDQTYDFVYFIETLEHILSEQIGRYLTELNRILKQGGYVFITTPHNENLEKYSVLCPDCGAVFHRVQHLNTFTEDSLSALMAKAGFTKILCQSAFLQKPTPHNKLKYFFSDKVLKRNFRPHLIYLGKKI